MSENNPVASVTPAISQPKTSTGSNLSVFMFLCAAALVGCFFLPWINFGGLVTVTGYKYAMAENASNEARMFLAIPVAALITILVGLAKPGELRGGARITGLLPLFGLIYALARYGNDVTQVLGAGAWLSLCIGVVLFVLGYVKPKA